MKFIKHIICILFLSLGINAYSQYIPSTTTEFSKSENGSIGKEKFTFSLYNSFITIVDNYYNTSKKYGPIFLDETSYDKYGYYSEFYKPDIKSDPFGFTSGKALIAYVFTYTSKGGNILFILEAKINSQQVSRKNFYTNEGYNKLISNHSSSNSELKETNFDISDVIMNSTTLSQIMAKISFSFEQSGEKKRSVDGAFDIVTYTNSSLIQALVKYTSQGNVAEIVFVMPKTFSDSIDNELIRKYGTKFINGEEVIQRGDLTYAIKSDENIGIIVIN
ncbi:hypothetical protein ACHRVK_22150 [Flavobacterium plurextorum]|uniref:hypothetical protein n=1 Tax=Flavobacterium TaxID=237 RepID=UPI00214D338C|nr:MULTISPECIES: hypothetical protein [Flavobacterium]UUW11008.1 hypothetical protein NLG42_09355 [Flavobacterium plurextorum]